MTRNSTKAYSFYRKLFMAQLEFEHALRYVDYYGEWGIVFVRYVTPYLWVVPLTVAIVLIVAFKRLRLFGPMQKCLISVMAVDVFFVIFVGLKDAIFNLLKWNYGFIEYRICSFVLNFIHIQISIYGTSLWIKSLMLIHRSFMFLFPFRFRYFNVKLFLVPFAFFHLLIIVLYCISTNTIPIEKITTIQEYVPQMPLKIIDACILGNDDKFFNGTTYIIIRRFRYFVHIIYFALLPFCIQSICTVVLIFMIRKQITKLSFLTPIGRTKIAQKVTYLVLIKAHIYLAVSFFVQEIPIYFAVISALYNQDTPNFQKSHSILVVYIYQTFAIGKLIDFLIYANLSRKVKSELKNLIFCKKWRKEEALK